MLSIEEYEHVMSLRGKGHTWDYIAEQYGIVRSTLKRKINTYKEFHEAPLTVIKGSGVGQPKRISEEPLFDTSRFRPQRASGDMLVTCDWHIPLYDPKMVNAVLKKAYDESIRTLIIGGDYWDMTSYSHYTPNQRDSTFELERDQGLEIASALTDWFDEIFMFWGNHDYRFLRGNDHRMSYVYGMRMLFEPLGPSKLSKFTFSELDYMFLEQDKLFRFSHQKNFSTIPLKVALELAKKHHTSIMTAHSHHCAIGVAKDGVNICIEGGGLFDKNITEYVQKTTTHHEWVQGYTLFKNGIPSIHSPIFGNV